MPGWREEAVAAVEQWLEAEGGRGRTARWVRLGTARRDAEPGWYRADLRGKQVDADELERLELRTAGGPEPGTSYRVLEAVQEGEILQVRVSAHVSAEELELRVQRQPKAFLIERLRDRLVRLTPSPLAEALASGALDPLPGTPPKEPAVLNPGQRLAYLACLGPGLRLVWGPPGTGKTMVLGRAITDLLRAGKRVLLASATNVAVDNALLQVARAWHPAPGELVRVGPPHLRAVLTLNPPVSLPQLVTDRCQAAEEQVAAVERQLVELDARAARLEQLQRVLEGYDHAEYLQAKRQLAAEERAAGLRQRAQQRAAALAAAREACAQAEAARERAEAAWAATAAPRAELAEADRLERTLAELDAAAGRLQAEVLRLRERRRFLEEARRAASRPLGARLLGWRERRQQRAELDAVDRELRVRVEEERAAQARLERLRPVLERSIAERRRQAAPLTPEGVAGQEAELHEARRKAAAAGQRVATAEAELKRARADLQAASTEPPPTPAQRQLVVEAERAGLPGRHAERELLRRRVEQDKPERKQLAGAYERLQGWLRALRRDAEGEVIRGARLVATTLARFRLHQAVYEGAYDAVLIDEVSTATIPEVLLAVARARETAVLLGDFLQLPAVSPKGFRKRPTAEVQRWLLRDCFELCGISDPADAERAPSCAVLSLQYRFGQDITDLANKLLYRGVLRAGSARPRPPDDPEVVLVDTDGLGDLGTLRREGRAAGWWPAGSLLARMLAQHHQRQGAQVGIVTPYRLQVEATLEALRDVERPDRPLATEVGTVHRFQGREFDVVVFDLAEDGHGWIAQGRSDGWSSWAREGARLLNVGITRAKHRLYLIASGQAVRQAPRGTALAPLRELLDQERVAVVRATELLTPTGMEPEAPSGPVAQDLGRTLAEYVRVEDIHDERSFYAAFDRYLREAQRSVWIWAAWTGERLAQVLPLLEAAVGRGVTVTVFVRTDRDTLMRKESFQAWLRRLRATASRVIRYHDMHQKLVVIDEQLVLQGSLNVLSHRNTREVMVAQRGQCFARKMLAHEHAHEFATPPPCGRCGSGEVELCRSSSEQRGFPWYWRCATGGCRWRQDVSLARHPAAGTASPT